MAYRWEWNCFHCSLVIIKFVSILIANGQSTVKESEDACLSIEELLNELQYKEQLDRRMQAFDSILQKQKQLLEGIYSNIVRPRDCSDLRKSGFDSSGIYEVMIPGHSRPIVNVYCDMDSNGTGWLVFQRRMDGSVDFNRGWNEYANGFGNKSGEFWLGNDLLHLLTSNRTYKLRVDVEDFEGGKRFAEYGTFSIGSAADKYRLTVDDYSGNAGESFAYHNGMQFTTKDSDNDEWGSNCAYDRHGAWWYNACHASNLNGPYLRGDQSSSESVGVHWRSFRGNWYSLKFSEMKISPALINKF